MQVNSCAGFIPGTQFSKLRNGISRFFCKCFKCIFFGNTFWCLLERAGAPGLFSGTGLEDFLQSWVGAGLAESTEQPLHAPAHVPGSSWPCYTAPCTLLQGTALRSLQRGMLGMADCPLDVLLLRIQPRNEGLGLSKSTCSPGTPPISMAFTSPAAERRTPPPQPSSCCNPPGLEPCTGCW